MTASPFLTRVIADWRAAPERTRGARRELVLAAFRGRADDATKARVLDLLLGGTSPSFVIEDFNYSAMRDRVAEIVDEITNENEEG